MDPTLREIVDYLRSEAAKLSVSAQGRFQGGEGRDLTAKELRASKALAERMVGRKLPNVSTDPKDNKAYCDMQVRIGEKLVIESKQLSAWADFLEKFDPENND